MFTKISLLNEEKNDLAAQKKDNEQNIQSLFLLKSFIVHSKSASEKENKRIIIYPKLRIFSIQSEE